MRYFPTRNRWVAGGRLINGRAKDKVLPLSMYNSIFSIILFCRWMENFLKSRSPLEVNSMCLIMLGVRTIPIHA